MTMPAKASDNKPDNTLYNTSDSLSDDFSDNSSDNLSDNSSDYILEINDLHMVYRSRDGDSHAINGIDLALPRGKTVGLVGESGAGKTSTALCIMGLLPKAGAIERGSILFNGRDLLESPDSEMRELRGEKISMIFQDPMTSLNPVIPIGDQIEEVLFLHKKSGSNGRKGEFSARVDEILTMVGISPARKGNFPHEFSGGMRQRVVIAIALACEPELLIADEPTTALDVTIQAQVLDTMANLKRELNTTMILITHDLGLVTENCDFVSIMYAGEILESGTVEDVFSGGIHHPYTTGLFGSIPNLRSKAKRLSHISGLMPDPANLPKGCKFHPRCPNCIEICKTDAPENHFFGRLAIKCHLVKDSEA